MEFKNTIFKFKIFFKFLLSLLLLLLYNKKKKKS